MDAVVFSVLGEVDDPAVGLVVPSEVVVVELHEGASLVDLWDHSDMMSTMKGGERVHQKKTIKVRT